MIQGRVCQIGMMVPVTINGLDASYSLQPWCALALGVYSFFKYEDDNVTISGYVRCVGVLEVLDQVKGVLTLILVGAALVSIFLEEYVDSVVILAIVVLNAFLGYTQEYRAEQSMAALKRMAVPTVKVRRDGRVDLVRLPPGTDRGSG